MLRATAVVENSFHKVQDAAEREQRTILRKAAFRIRKDISASIQHRADSRRTSEPGEPPYQHQPGFFRRALWVHSDNEGAIVGFRASKVDQVAAIHEHGEEEDGRDYPERPMVAPALERNVEQFHRDWRAAIG